MKLVASDALSLTALRVSDDVCLCDHHFTVFPKTLSKVLPTTRDRPE